MRQSVNNSHSSEPTGPIKGLAVPFRDNWPWRGAVLEARNLCTGFAMQLLGSETNHHSIYRDERRPMSRLTLAMRASHGWCGTFDGRNVVGTLRVPR